MATLFFPKGNLHNMLNHNVWFKKYCNQMCSIQDNILICSYLCTNVVLLLLDKTECDFLNVLLKMRFLFFVILGHKKLFSNYCCRENRKQNVQLKKQLNVLHNNKKNVDAYNKIKHKMLGRSCNILRSSLI